jgi:transcriptional regulator with XRE-family HTH domain
MNITTEDKIEEKKDEVQGTPAAKCEDPQLSDENAKILTDIKNDCEAMCREATYSFADFESPIVPKPPMTAIFFDGECINGRTYLKEWMEELEWSVHKAYTDLIGMGVEEITEKDIQSWVDGESNPNSNQLLIMSILLETPIDDLVRKNPKNDTGRRDEFVSTNLKWWMRYQEVSMEELAKKTELSYRQIHRYYYGDDPMTLYDAKDIASALDITLDQLIHVHPNDYVCNHMRCHTIRTMRLKSAVRLQNYCKAHGIDVTVKVCRYYSCDNADHVPATKIVYQVEYEYNCPLEAWDIIKIIHNPWYMDSREKARTDKMRFKDMEVVDI